MGRLTLSLTLLFTIAGCGARSGLLSEGVVGLDGGTRDGGSVPRDAGERRDAASPRDTGIDAGLVMCPTPGGIGFGLRHAGRLELPPSLEPGELALGGDGTRIFLAVSFSADGGAPGLLYELSASLAAIDQLPFRSGRSLEIGVDGGVVRLATLASDGAGVIVYEGARASTALERISRTEGAPLFRLARPAWNGVDVVIAGDDTASGVFVGALVDEAISPAWLATGPASFAEVAVDPSTGVTHVLYRDGASNRVLERFDREGNALTPGGVFLADVGFVGPVAFGFSDDVRVGQLVLVGVTEEEEGDRVTLRRFRTDGTPGAGFSQAFTLGPDGSISLTTVPPTGHRTGYGMVASDGVAAVFHGAGEDFVGDGRRVPITCDGPDGIAIASTPCGYLIACLDGSGVDFAWAIPQPPR